MGIRERPTNQERADRREALGGMPSPLVALLLGVAGFVVVALVMLIGVGADDDPCTGRPLLVPRVTSEGESCSRLFLTSKEGVMWILALCVQGAVWAVGAAPLFAGLAAWWRNREIHGKRHAAEIAATGVAGAVLVLGPVAVALLDPIDSPLPRHTQRITLITALGAVVAFAGFANLAILDLAARRMGVQVKSGEKAPATGGAADFLALRRTLDGLLTLLATLVTIAVLSSGLLMRAMQENVDSDRYSPVLMWPYALYLVGILALVYVPTHLRLRGIGEEMRDARFPARLPGELDYDDNVKHRKEMDELLRLREGPAVKLKSSLTILAPLLGTFAASVLGT